MNDKEKLEYNKILANFLNIKVEEFGYPQWDFKLLGLLDDEGDFRTADNGTTLTFDASMDWNILIKVYSNLNKLQKNLSNLDFNFPFFIIRNKPELAFKALAEYIKANKL